MRSSRPISIPHSTVAIDRDGWLHTGDMAKKRPDGYLVFMGRYKDMLKVGGENVSPAEVEAYLRVMDEVRDAAVVAYPGERLGERACAVVVPQAGQSIDLPSIVEFMKSQKVAVQYIPQRLIVRDAMPSTPSGKIQKFKLRDRGRTETTWDREAAGITVKR